MTTYAAILSGPAQLIDPNARPQTFKVVQPEKEKRETPFNYIDTASSRAEIDVVTAKLKKLNRIAIAGLGGTGSTSWILSRKRPYGRFTFMTETLPEQSFRSPAHRRLPS